MNTSAVRIYQQCNTVAVAAGSRSILLCDHWKPEKPIRSAITHRWRRSLPCAFFSTIQRERAKAKRHSIRTCSGFSIRSRLVVVVLESAVALALSSAAKANGYRKLVRLVTRNRGEVGESTIYLFVTFFRFYCVLNFNSITESLYKV